MNFSIDYEKIGELGNYLLSKSQEIDKLYDELINICKSIDENWESKDSSVYVYKIETFINELAKENEQIVGTGNLLNKIAGVYNDQDNKWNKKLLSEENEINE
jgi:hypothetical protein